MGGGVVAMGDGPDREAIEEGLVELWGKRKTRGSAPGELEPAEAIRGRIPGEDVGGDRVEFKDDVVDGEAKGHEVGHARIEIFLEIKEHI